MNWKDVGDMGVAGTVGELGKFGITCAFPMSDNLPFDLIAIIDGKLYKLQVKSSSRHKNGRLAFRFQGSNKYSQKFYTKNDCDYFACYDLVNHILYLVPFNDKTKNIHIRYSKAGNNANNVQHAENYILSKENLLKFFNYKYEYNPTNLFWEINTECLKKDPTKYTLVCEICKKQYVSYSKKRFCSSECYGKHKEKIKWPDNETLSSMVLTMPMTKIGKELGVTDNAVKKHCIKNNIAV